jgi:hypothetical protein
VINPEDCDGLLWNALYQIATGHAGIEKWEGEPGHWFRKPKVERDEHGACFYRDEEGEPVDNGSKAENSRDMFLGLFNWIWDRQDLGKAQDIASYGRNASPPWFMGDGMNFFVRESTTAFRPSFLGTFFELVYQLGGEDNLARKYPYTPSSRVNGFQLHLMVLHTLFRGQIMGGISDFELEKLEEASNKQPENAFYSAAYHYFKDGDQTHATNLLLDESLWPADRLPTSAERCSDYIYQRDYDRDEPGGDWAPCPEENRTFPGTGLMFTFKVISNQLRPTR